MDEEVAEEFTFGELGQYGESHVGGLLEESGVAETDLEGKEDGEEMLGLLFGG